MSSVFAPAAEGLILIAAVYALTYGGAGLLIYYAGKTIWRMWRK